VSNIVLAGAFGQRNPGDEALLKAFLRTLPGWSPIATSSHPLDTRQEHGCEAVNVGDPVALARVVQEARAVVFVGALCNVLCPHAGRRPDKSLRRAVAIALGAKAVRKSVALLAVGVGSLPTARLRSLARHLVHLANLLVLRDEESASVLARAGLRPPFRVGTDAAWVLFGGEPFSPLTAEDAIVALDARSQGPNAVERLASGLQAIRALGLEVRLQPWQINPGAWDDLALARALALRMGDAEVLPPPEDLEAARRLYAGRHLVVALRLHAAMAAAAAGAPFVGVAHDHKLTAVARRFGQPSIPAAAPPAAWSTAASAAMEGVPPSREVVRGEIRDAEHTFRLLRLLLTHGQEPDHGVSGLRLAPDPWELAGVGPEGRR
jgi:polysaccharide pyruvyl transferase WcaK-like protein